jgi:hypothetical protein
MPSSERIAHCRQLFYVSEAVQGLGDTDVRRILDISRYHNGHEHITGCLLFSGRHFAQVIEGSALQVENLLGRIRADRRHRHMRVRVDRLVPRMYDDWSMGFLYSLDLADQLAAFHANPAATADESLHFMAAIHPDTVIGPL